MQTQVDPQPSLTWINGRGLYSVFQPIYSFSNQSCIGYEVLIRGKDPSGKKLPIYECLQVPEQSTRKEYTQAFNRMHLNNWQSVNCSSCWLFINIDFEGIENYDEICLKELLDEMGINGQKIVIEVVESEIPDETIFNQVIKAFKEIGCLIALDDFGAGHSNIDRIWKAQPDIVKLDRQVLLEAAKSVRSESVLRNLTRLIQQSGCISLLEGIETEEQALLAMDVGIDLVQGFYFAKPSIDVNNMLDGQGRVKNITQDFPSYQNERLFKSRMQRNGYKALFEEVCADTELAEILEKLKETSCLSFVKRHFVLDAEGYQISESCFDHWDKSDDDCGTTPKRNVLNQSKGLCWKNRRYFIKALNNPNSIFVSQPYRSIVDMELCMTISKTIELRSGEMIVVCFDVVYLDKSVEAIQISV